MAHILESHHLIEIPMAQLHPTWNNHKTSEVLVARRLDRFLIHEYLTSSGISYRQWVGTDGIYDHSPIYLELAPYRRKPCSPFKFNATWLACPEYIDLVTNYWNTHPIAHSISPSSTFAAKMNAIKKLTKSWARDKIKKDEDTLNKTEQAITEIELTPRSGTCSKKKKSQIS